MLGRKRERPITPITVIVIVEDYLRRQQNRVRCTTEPRCRPVRRGRRRLLLVRRQHAAIFERQPTFHARRRRASRQARTGAYDDENDWRCQADAPCPFTSRSARQHRLNVSFTISAAVATAVVASGNDVDVDTDTRNESGIDIDLDSATTTTAKTTTMADEIQPVYNTATASPRPPALRYVSFTMTMTGPWTT